MIKHLAWPALLVLVSCSPATQPTHTPAPETDPTSTSSVKVDAPPVVDSADPFVVDGLLREEQLPLLKGPPPSFNEVVLPAAVKGVPPLARSCDPYMKPTGKGPACADKPAALAALDKAMAKPAGLERDEALALLESCAALEPGVVRVLRIELAPPECADALVEPLLKAKPAGMSGSVQHALVGHAIAARLTRTVGKPPQLGPPYSKDKVLEFSKKKMFPWFEEQAVAVEQLSKQGRELASYGKGIVAVASGWANLRLVEAVRDVPIPDDFKKDPEVLNAFYGELDRRLDPKKKEGRDGALVGLGEMAMAGVIHDERVRTTRALLAKMYGGRRVDGLDILALPALSAPPAETVEQRLAAALPTFVTATLLDPGSAKDPKTMRALLGRGIPLRFRAALKEQEASLSDETKALYARGRLELGVRYWRAVDFDAAVALYAKLPRATISASDRMLHALCIALRGGPEHVAAMMVSLDPFGPKFADVRALDLVAAEPGKATGGLAAFDAAVLRQIAAPIEADAKYWDGLALRYRTAASLLEDGRVRFEADERAKTASATARVKQTTAP